MEHLLRVDLLWEILWLVEGGGAFAQGLTKGGGTGDRPIQARSPGSFAQGTTTGNLAFTAAIGTALSTASGSFAQGYSAGTTGNSIVQASNDGTFAQGYALNFDITASGAGSFAQGRATTASIEATATNAVQFGPGTNSIANSLQITSGGISLYGSSSAA